VPIRDAASSVRDRGARFSPDHGFGSLKIHFCWSDSFNSLFFWGGGAFFVFYSRCSPSSTLLTIHTHLLWRGLYVVPHKPTWSIQTPLNFFLLGTDTRTTSTLKFDARTHLVHAPNVLWCLSLEASAEAARWEHWECGENISDVLPRRWLCDSPNNRVENRTERRIRTWWCTRWVISRRQCSWLVGAQSGTSVRMTLY